MKNLTEKEIKDLIVVGKKNVRLQFQYFFINVALLALNIALIVFYLPSR